MGVHIGNGKGHVALALRADGHGAHDHVHRAGIEGINAVGGFYEAEVHLIGIAEDIAGNLAGNIHLEAAHVAGGGIAVAHQVIGTVHAHDETTALDDVRNPLLRLLIVRAVAALNLFLRGALRGGGAGLFNLRPFRQRRARPGVEGALGGRLQRRGGANIAGGER